MKSLKDWSFYRTRLFKLWVGYFVLLLIVNFARLCDPPYWDGVMGIYGQSIWLLENDFSIIDLVQEPSFFEGGPRIMPISYLSWLFAFLSFFLSTTVVLFIMHLQNLVLAALCAASLTEFLSSYMSLGLSIVTVLIGVSEPMWSAQAATFYQEIPQAACFGLAILAYQRDRLLWVVVLACLSMFIKPSSLILALALAMQWPVLMIYRRYVSGGEGEAQAVYLGKETWLLLPLALNLLYSVIFPMQLSSQIAIDVNDSLESAQYLFPTFGVVLLFGLGAAVLIWLLPRTRLHFRTNYQDFRNASLLCTLCWGFALSYFLFPMQLCRYWVAIIVPGVVLASWLIGELLSKKLLLFFLVCLLLFNIGNQYGSFLPRLPVFLRRSGDFLERSRESVLDLEALASALKKLEQIPGVHERVIVAEGPIAHMISRTEYGYVQKPFSKVLATGPVVPEYLGVKRVQLADLKQEKPIFIFCRNVFYKHWLKVGLLNPSSEIKILYADKVLGGEFIIYEQR